jgi:hypothetical protein
MSASVVSVTDLQDLAKIGMNYSRTFLTRHSYDRDFELLAIFLYGSAARCHLGLATDHGDWDIGLVLRMLRPSEERSHVSTRNRPLDLTTFKGKTVQVTRNVFSSSLVEPEAALRQLAQMKSPRWKSIRASPVIMLYPQIKTIWRATVV